jgi:hypothetical protein
VLFQRGRAQAWLLTLVCLLFTAVLAMGALAGLAYFQPGSGAHSLLAAAFAPPGHRLAWLDLLLPALPTLAMAAVEPVYVAAGFGLYLNRRVQLEAWDLEQAFRQLGQRARNRAGQVLLALLLAFAGWHLRAQALRPPPATPPARILGLDIRPAGLPPDLPEAAGRLWDQGDTRGALALLYRGALAHLVHGLGVPLTAGATEGDCLRLGGLALAEPGAEYFARLTATWQRVAYGGQPAAGQDRDLCAAWTSHFLVRP